MRPRLNLQLGRKSSQIAGVAEHFAPAAVTTAAVHGRAFARDRRVAVAFPSRPRQNCVDGARRQPPVHPLASCSVPTNGAERGHLGPSNQSSRTYARKVLEAAMYLHVTF